MPNTQTSPDAPPAQWRVYGLAGLVFLILGSYGFARPSTESLFIEAHGATALPQVWILVALGSVLVVTIYNRWSRTTDLVVLFGVVSTVSAALLVLLLGTRDAAIPGWAYALYVWKDLYIVVLIEIFWSFANSVFRVDRARRIYGMFLLLGSMGSMTGSLLSSRLAERLGSENLLWCVVPILLLAAAGSWALGRGQNRIPKQNQTRLKRQNQA